jgi:putative transposase
MSRSHRMAMIEREAPALSVRRQCALLGLARSGVYRVAPAPDPQDLALMRRLDALYLELPFYGSRKMTLALKAEGHAVNRKRVQRLMRTMGLEALVPRPGTSRPAPGHQVHPYLLKGLAIERANQVWAADITYIPMARGFLYLVAVMDWASRAVLAWRLSNTLDVAFCVEALAGALARHGRPEICNTDQGAQFTSAAFTGRLKQAGVAISMDGRGRWLDNLFVERLWRSLKYEEVHLKAYGDGRAARAGIGAWIAFYNERRPHQALAYRTPMAVWRDGVTAVDMTLRLDDAGASPPCPQPHQPQAA